MSALAQLSASPMVHALGWALLHFCWQGLVIASLLACVLYLVPLRASRLRYAAACTALACMVVSPLITFGVLMADQQSGQRQLVIATVEANRGLIPFVKVGQSTEPWTVRCEIALNHSLPAVIGFWIAGVLIFLCRLNFGLMATRRWKSMGAEPATPELQQVLQALRKRLGINRAVRLLHSAQVQAPVVIGWLRPVILIPIGCLAGLSPLQVEAIFAHELGHIRRHDYLVNMAQSIAETVLFYHPAVWWVSSRVRQEREHCCDDFAVAITGDRLAYATALSCLEERRGGPAPAGAFAATGGILKTRITRLLGLNRTPVFPRTAAVILLALAGTAAGLIAHGAVHAQSAASKEVPSSNKLPAGEVAGPYDEWLNQEVRWIITPEERDAYLRLTTNQERDEFIEQFWERRNPNPGSIENPFRREHYRRMAYANTHFTAGGEQGLDSGRGHVYIVFGPPDSIDSHPAGGNSTTRPLEIWHYRTIRFQEPAVKTPNGSDYTEQSAVLNDVDFRFADECNCGRYDLKSPWPSAAAAKSAINPPFVADGTGPGVQFLSDTEGVDFRDWITHWWQTTDNTLRSEMPQTTILEHPAK